MDSSIDFHDWRARTTKSIDESEKSRALPEGARELAQPGEATAPRSSSERADMTGRPCDLPTFLNRIIAGLRPHSAVKAASVEHPAGHVPGTRITGRTSPHWAHGGRYAGLGEWRRR